VIQQFILPQNIWKIDYFASNTVNYSMTANISTFIIIVVNYTHFMQDFSQLHRHRQQLFTRKKQQKSKFSKQVI
jgi:hypothetical protein